MVQARYTATAKLVLWLCVAGFVALDVLTLHAACGATPDPSRLGATVGVLLQLCAVGSVAFALQYFAWTCQPPRQTAAWMRWRIVTQAAILCFLSVMLFRQSILFADTFTQRGAISVGKACFR